MQKSRLSIVYFDRSKTIILLLIITLTLLFVQVLVFPASCGIIHLAPTQTSHESRQLRIQFINSILSLVIIKCNVRQGYLQVDAKCCKIHINIYWMSGLSNLLSNYRGWTEAVICIFSFFKLAIYMFVLISYQMNYFHVMHLLKFQNLGN